MGGKAPDFSTVCAVPCLARAGPLAEGAEGFDVEIAKYG